MSDDSKGQPCCAGIENWLRPEIFKALSDRNRASILMELARADTEQSVSEVARCCPIDLSVVSRHLGTLRKAGLVDAERRGKEVYYSLKVNELVGLLRGLADALEACCPDGSCTLTTEHDGGCHDGTKRQK